jgi:hypothetical protein
MKFKPKRSDIYDIVGFVEGEGKYSKSIGAIICRGSDGTTFEVGSFSITDEERNKLWDIRDNISNYSCKVAYQHRWPSGKPKSGVFVELVEKEKKDVDFNLLI